MKGNDGYLWFLAQIFVRSLISMKIIDGKKKKKKPAVFVCRKHWPESTPTFKCRGKERPIDPPSMFSVVGGSSTTSPPSQSLVTRATKRALSSVRSISPDEMGPFLEQNVLKFDEIEAKLSADNNVMTTS